MGLLIKLGLLLLIVVVISGYLAHRAIVGKLKKVVTKAVVAAQPEEIHLIRDRQVEWSDPQAITDQVRTLRTAGFRTITSYRIEELEEFHLISLAHPEKGWAAVLYEHRQAGVWCDLVAEFQDGGSLTVTSAEQGDDQSQPPEHDKVYLEKAPVPRLLGAFQKRLGERPVAAVSATNFAEFFHRSWAQEVAWRRHRATPTEEAEILERDPELDRRCQPLFAAIAAGRRESLRQLLDTGIRPEGRDARGRTPLITAAAGGHLAMVREILKARAAVNARAPGNPGEAAFERRPSMASMADSIEDPEARKLLRGLSQLVDGGNAPEVLNVTALSTAIETGNAEVVRALVRAGADLSGDGGLTPLQFVAREGDPDVVRELLDGLHPDTPESDDPDDDQPTPLMLAAQGGHVVILQALLSAGAEVNRASGGDTALVRAAGPPTFMNPADQPATVRLLVTAGASLEPLEEELRSKVLETMAEEAGGFSCGFLGA